MCISMISVLFPLFQVIPLFHPFTLVPVVVVVPVLELKVTNNNNSRIITLFQETAHPPLP